MSIRASAALDRLISLFFYFQKRRPLRLLRFKFNSPSEMIRVIEKRGFDKHGARNLRRLNQVNDQTTWLNSLESCGMKFDFIGRFERLEEDVLRLTQILGLEAGSVPHQNSSEHGDPDEYFDDDDKDLIADLYHREIERFGFEV